MAMTEKKCRDPFDQIKKFGKIEQNPVFPGSSKLKRTPEVKRSK